MRLLILLLSLSACSRTVKEAAESDLRTRTKIEALAAIKSGETEDRSSETTVKAGPRKIVIVAPWDEPAPTPAEPKRVIHHPKTTTIDQGPVEIDKKTEDKRAGWKDEKDALRIDAAKDEHATKTSVKDTEIGPPRWMIGLAICLVVLIAACVAVVYVRWFSKKAAAVVDLVVPESKHDEGP